MMKTESLAAAIGLLGDGLRVRDEQPVYGGDINRAYKLTLSDGSAVFLKSNTIGNLSFFAAEAKGLHALANAKAIGVPRPVAYGTDEAQGISFLLMEYLEPAPKVADYWEEFGHELAALHRADCSGAAGGRFGFAEDNYIGATPQRNTPTADWISFFRDCRLGPQLRMADHYFDPDTRRRGTRLLEGLERYLTEPENPSLLHGDLWSGNAICGPDGKAWIMDPAVYVGHHEADLAMTELFGGFPGVFYQSYAEVDPIDAGYRDRRDLYNLYHLLNHLNLFGRSYLGAVRRILERYA